MLDFTLYEIELILAEYVYNATKTAGYILCMFKWKTMEPSDGVRILNGWMEQKCIDKYMLYFKDLFEFKLKQWSTGYRNLTKYQ